MNRVRRTPGVPGSPAAPPSAWLGMGLVSLSPSARLRPPASATPRRSREEWGPDSLCYPASSAGWAPWQAVLSGERLYLDTMRLGNRLRVARAEHRLSQEALAGLAGVTRQTISAIENQQYIPSALLAFTLAHRLGVPVTDLFYLEEADS